MTRLPNTRFLVSLVPVLPLLLASAGAGCSSSSGSRAAPASDSGASGDSGVGGDAGSGPVLAPPPAGQGIQLKMETTIAASSEDERCKFVQTTEDMWVHSEDVRYTPGSHHFILWNTTYTSIPTKDNKGNTVDTSGVFECPGGPPDGWNVNQYVGGAQSADAPPILGALPANVALHIPAGAVLVLDLHVLNASTQPLDTTVLMNLVTIPQSQVTQEAGIYFFYDPFIVVPPGASAHARMSCPVTSNVTLTTAQTHMHKWGLGGVANLEDSTGKVLQQLYSSSVWTNPPVTEWSAPPMNLQTGQQIDYECNYQNNDTTAVVQGLSAATNEMCVFAGAYYPRDTKFETCGTSGQFGDLGTAATYIGTGTKSCIESLSCLQTATPYSQDQGASLFGCVVNSCPAVAVPFTTAFDCVINSQNPLTDCATQISACQAASCGP